MQGASPYNSGDDNGGGGGYTGGNAATSAQGSARGGSGFIATTGTDPEHALYPI